MDVTLEDWVKRAGNKPIPSLSQTITELKYVIAKKNAPITQLGAIVERDPGLTVHLLRHCNEQSKGRLKTDVTSIQQALMMLGTDQVGELPDTLPSLEKTLQEQAQIRLLMTFSRAYHAAQQATNWAISRRDMSPEEVFAATQLHFLAEMYIAIDAPELLTRIDNMRNEKNIASEEAQYIVLGFTLDQLTSKLANLWQLPSLVREALHPENAKYPRAYGIMLAVQLARGAAVDWYSEKTRLIQEQVAEWLDIELDQVIAETHRTAVEVAHKSTLYKVVPCATRLPLIQCEAKNQPAVNDQKTDNNIADICLTPQTNKLKELIGHLNQPELPTNNAYQLISFILKGLHDGIGLNRVVFARFDNESKTLRPEKIIGADNDPIFSRFEISLNLPHLFSRLMEKNQAILINDQNRNKYWTLVPDEFQKLIGTNSFTAMSVVINQRPLGLFYADRHSSACQVDQRSYQYFKAVCNHASQALQRLPKLDFSQS